MIKTIKTHTGMRISLQSDFAKVPDGTPHLVLEVRNDAIARRYIDILLDDIRQEIGYLHMLSTVKGISGVYQKKLESAVKEYDELSCMKTVIDSNILRG